MEHVDTALLVTNVAKSSRRGVQHLEDLLEQNNLKHASFVLNGVRTKRWAYYYNRYASNTATPRTAPNTAMATGTGQRPLQGPRHERLRPFGATHTTVSANRTGQPDLVEARP